MPFPLPVGHKFSCVALANAGVARELRTAIDLGDELWVLFEPPFELEGHWREWLGTVRAEYLSRANLVVLAHHASATAEANQGEYAHLLLSDNTRVAIYDRKTPIDEWLFENRSEPKSIPATT